MISKRNLIYYSWGKISRGGVGHLFQYHALVSATYSIQYHTLVSVTYFNIMHWYWPLISNYSQPKVQGSIADEVAKE